MNIGALIAVIPLVGVIVGLAGAKFRRAPLVAAGLVVAAYGFYMAAHGIWAGMCWDCGGVSQTRGDVFVVSAIFFGLIALTTLLGVWLGARLATMLQRLLRTWREIRAAAGRGDTTPAGPGNA